MARQANQFCQAKCACMKTSFQIRNSVWVSQTVEPENEGSYRMATTCYGSYNRVESTGKRAFGQSAEKRYFSYTNGI